MCQPGNSPNVWIGLVRRSGLHLVDDLDPEAERQLCELAEKACGLPAVFVLGFPLSGRPFYTPEDSDYGGRIRFVVQWAGDYDRRPTSASRADLEAALKARGSFRRHLKII
jgi:nondiscriminating aspartyl-tRNA synthetase